MSEKTYKQVALEDPSGRWELHQGQLRQKPGMTAEHNDIQSGICRQLYRQLDEHEYDVRADFSRVRRSSESYYIPDVFVVPRGESRAQRGTGRLEVFALPLPLVVEVWSPSTGDYDVEAKIPEYKARGDLEIWRVHPYDRTLTVWIRQPDGGYAERNYTTGIVQPTALPGVTIDLDVLFS